MFKTPKPVAYPADPNVESMDYEQGTELRDPGLTEAADYFARLASWYTQGGSKDENGQWPNLPTCSSLRSSIRQAAS